MSVYNEKIKQSFLIRSTNQDKKDVFVLNLVTPKFEERLQKDLAQFSVQEVYDMLRDSGFFNAQTLRTIIRTGKLYCRWCIEKHIFNVTRNPFDYVVTNDVDLVPTVKDRFIASPDVFASIVTSVYQPKDAMVITPTLCFLWFGIPYKDMMSIRRNDFTYEALEVFVPSQHRLYKHIPQAIADILHEYAQTNSTMRYSGFSSYAVYADVADTFIKKMLPKNSKIHNAPLTYRTLMQAFYLFNAEYGKLVGKEHPLDQDVIAKSGIMWNIFEMEMNGFDLHDPYNVSILMNIIGTQHKSIVSDYMRLYDVYKHVFHC